MGYKHEILKNKTVLDITNIITATGVNLNNFETEEEVVNEKTYEEETVGSKGTVEDSSINKTIKRERKLVLTQFDSLEDEMRFLRTLMEQPSGSNVIGVFIKNLSKEEIREVYQKLGFENKMALLSMAKENIVGLDIPDLKDGELDILMDNSEVNLGEKSRIISGLMVLKKLGSLNKVFDLIGETQKKEILETEYIEDTLKTLIFNVTGKKREDLKEKLTTVGVAEKKIKTIEEHSVKTTILEGSSEDKQECIRNNSSVLVNLINGNEIKETDIIEEIEKISKEEANKDFNLKNLKDSFLDSLKFISEAQTLKFSEIDPNLKIEEFLKAHSKSDSGIADAKKVDLIKYLEQKSVEAGKEEEFPFTEENLMKLRLGASDNEVLSAIRSFELSSASGNAAKIKEKYKEEDSLITNFKNNIASIESVLSPEEKTKLAIFISKFSVEVISLPSGQSEETIEKSVKRFASSIVNRSSVGDVTHRLDIDFYLKLANTKWTVPNEEFNFPTKESNGIVTNVEIELLQGLGAGKSKMFGLFGGEEGDKYDLKLDKISPLELVSLRMKNYSKTRINNEFNIKRAKELVQFFKENELEYSLFQEPSSGSEDGVEILSEKEGEYVIESEYEYGIFRHINKKTSKETEFTFEDIKMYKNYQENNGVIDDVYRSYNNVDENANFSITMEDISQRLNDIEGLRDEAQQRDDLIRILSNSVITGPIGDLPGINKPINGTTDNNFFYHTQALSFFNKPTQLKEEFERLINNEAALTTSGAEAGSLTALVYSTLDKNINLPNDKEGLVKRGIIEGFQKQVEDHQRLRIVESHGQRLSAMVGGRVASKGSTISKTNILLLNSFIKGEEMTRAELEADIVKGGENNEVFSRYIERVKSVHGLSKSFRAEQVGEFLEKQMEDKKSIFPRRESDYNLFNSIMKLVLVQKGITREQMKEQNVTFEECLDIYANENVISRTESIQIERIRKHLSVTQDFYKIDEKDKMIVEENKDFLESLKNSKERFDYDLFAIATIGKSPEEVQKLKRAVSIAKKITYIEKGEFLLDKSSFYHRKEIVEIEQDIDHRIRMEQEKLDIQKVKEERPKFKTFESKRERHKKKTKERLMTLKPKLKATKPGETVKLKKSFIQPNVANSSGSLQFLLKNTVSVTGSSIDTFKMELGIGDKKKSGVLKAAVIPSYEEVVWGVANMFPKQGVGGLFLEQLGVNLEDLKKAREELKGLEEESVKEYIKTMDEYNEEITNSPKLEKQKLSFEGSGFFNSEVDKVAEFNKINKVTEDTSHLLKENVITGIEKTEQGKEANNRWKKENLQKTTNLHINKIEHHLYNFYSNVVKEPGATLPENAARFNTGVYDGFEELGKILKETPENIKKDPKLKKLIKSSFGGYDSGYIDELVTGNVPVEDIVSRVQQNAKETMSLDTENYGKLTEQADKEQKSLVDLISQVIPGAISVKKITELEQFQGDGSKKLTKAEGLNLILLTNKALVKILDKATTTSSRELDIALKGGDVDSSVGNTKIIDVSEFTRGLPDGLISFLTPTELLKNSNLSANKIKVIKTYIKGNPDDIPAGFEIDKMRVSAKAFLRAYFDIFGLNVNEDEEVEYLTNVKEIKGKIDKGVVVGEGSGGIILSEYLQIVSTRMESLIRAGAGEQGSVEYEEIKVEPVKVVIKSPDEKEDLEAQKIEKDELDKFKGEFEDSGEFKKDEIVEIYKLKNGDLVATTKSIKLSDDVSVDTGKDGFELATKTKDGQVVKKPGTSIMISLPKEKGLEELLEENSPAKKKKSSKKNNQTPR